METIIMTPTKLIQDISAALTTNDLMAALEREAGREKLKFVSYEVFAAKLAARKSSKAA